MESFFKVKTPDEVFEIIERFDPCGREKCPVDEACGRVLSEDIVSPEDLPGFYRSTMDGYAVRAKDTFGASESIPALLELSGEVMMGAHPGMDVGPGKAVKISTGGMLPDKADGVVMKEYCHLLDETTLEVNRAISPFENVIQRGDDFRKGATILKKSRLLRPQDVGAMAGVGMNEAPVFSTPRMAIISTGDEIAPIDASLEPGQVRDINRYTLGSFCRQYGAKSLYMGLCRDDFEPLKRMVQNALGQADAVWISGGSSVGTRDLTLKIFETLPDFELLVHGISISPGKPTIIGTSGSKPLIGLPGHVASAMVVAEVFLRRLILRLSGRMDRAKGFQPRVEALLTRNIESRSGREDYIRVKLLEKEGMLMAEPVFGKSGLISTLVEADGLVRIGMNKEGLYEGQGVEVRLFR
ncbi:MAG: molybdopterin molybdotransferase MoeA [Deltaproteobacteria bacterium]|nr:molybdopterin molybdotransferase MoeA [Deltaproteobacteria bacterium]